jgi:hypothetical protein
VSRELQQDFKELIDFFTGYSLSSIEFTGDLRIYLSSQHKKYFSYLTFIAEIEALLDKELTPSVSVKQLEFLTESCSDIGNSIFLMINGAYKPSRMVLRSSIETFLKGFVLDEIIDIDTEKSVYALFDKVAALDFFNQDNPKIILNSIHTAYKTLCEDIHTATKINMAHITSMIYFPTVDNQKIKDISSISLKLVGNYIDLLGFKYDNYLHNMHHRNKEILLENISRIYRREILGLNK